MKPPATGTSKTEPPDSGWTIDLRQPLLKNAGWSYNMASVDIARMAEEDAICALRDRVIATVTSVIEEYHNPSLSYTLKKIAHTGSYLTKRLNITFHLHKG